MFPDDLFVEMTRRIVCVSVSQKKIALIYYQYVNYVFICQIYVR